MREAGFAGPVAVIPHGAWLPPPQDRNGYRHRLGLTEDTPLIGMFGHLKPYKRIAQSLRALQRLIRVAPDAKMILVGEPHPELNLDSLIAGLQLEPHVRALGIGPPSKTSPATWRPATSCSICDIRRWVRIQER